MVYAKTLIRNFPDPVFRILVLIPFLLPGCQKHAKIQPFSQDPYNIVWTEQSKDAAESMPLVGGDIGCNVWVEDGDVLLYVQRSGSLSENGEYLKLGRIRLKMDPNPFTGGASFRQELKLRDGYIEITSKVRESERQSDTWIKLWVETDRPIVHIDVEADTDIEVEAFYESWRTEDKELLDVPHGSRERFTCFNLEGYPGKVIRQGDTVAHTPQGVLFYHRNPDEKLVPDVMIRQQGLEAYADEIYDDIKHRTFGGVLQGTGFVEDGVEDGTYHLTPYRAWKLKSRQASPRHTSWARHTVTWDLTKKNVISASRPLKRSFKQASHWRGSFSADSAIFKRPLTGASSQNSANRARWSPS